MPLLFYLAQDQMLKVLRQPYGVGSLIKEMSLLQKNLSRGVSFFLRWIVVTTILVYTSD